MSSLYDMFSAFVAMLISAAFLHFGAAGDSRPAAPVATPAHSVAVIDTDRDEPVSTTPPPRNHVHKLSTQSHCHGSAGAMPVMDAVRAASPLRRS